jgi:hypothetical protein
MDDWQEQRVSCSGEDKPNFWCGENDWLEIKSTKYKNKLRDTKPTS